MKAQRSGNVAFVGHRTWGFLLALVTLSGCVLADPAPTLPLVAENAPNINAGSVTPPQNGQILTSWPTLIDIPVTVLDPSESLEWQAFEDFNSLTSPLPVKTAHNGTYGDGGAIDLVIRDLPQPLGPGCHTLKIVVAHGFSNDSPIFPPGGSVVSWFYAGSGNPGDCAGFDAGALNDAGSATTRAMDAGDGGM